MITLDIIYSTIKILLMLMIIIVGDDNDGDDDIIDNVDECTDLIIIYSILTSQHSLLKRRISNCSDTCKRH
jgi:hypothetical protein